MKSFGVYTPSLLGPEDLKSFMGSVAGGEWRDWSSMIDGAVHDGNATVYLSLVSHFPPDYLPPELVIEFKALFGEEPQTVVCIDISHSDGSEALAERVADEVIQKWGGLLDRDA